MLEHAGLFFMTVLTVVASTTLMAIPGGKLSGIVEKQVGPLVGNICSQT